MSRVSLASPLSSRRPDSLMVSPSFTRNHQNSSEISESGTVLAVASKFDQQMVDLNRFVVVARSLIKCSYDFKCHFVIHLAGFC